MIPAVSPVGCRRLTLRAVVGLWGCGVPEPPADYTVRDSADVVIAQSMAAAWGEGEGWTVSRAHELVVGEDPAGPALFRVWDATRLDDGAVVVANGGSLELIGFDAEGTHRFTVGGEGDGPGEFARMSTLRRYGGDSLVVFDSGHRRLTVFDRHGTLGRVLVVRGLTGQPIGAKPTRDGGFVMRATTQDVMEVGTGLMRVPEALVRIEPSGEMGATLARLDGYETFVFELGDARPPFARQGHFAVSGTRVVYGDAAGLEYREHDLANGRNRIVRAPRYPIEIPGPEREAAEADLRARRTPPGYDDLPERIIRALPDLGPGYDALLVDGTGHVWLREYLRPGAARPPERSWFVFDPAGRWLGTVAVPGSFEPFEIGADYLLGRWEDDQRVESVRLLRLER